MDEVIKKRKRKIVILIIIILVIIGLGVGFFLLKDTDDKEDNNNKLEEKNEEVLEDTYINLNRVKKVSNLSERQKLYSKDINSGEDEVLDYFYDGYYVTKEEDTHYLKRNEKVVSKIEKTEDFVLYKDENDSNSKYIAIKYNGYDIFEVAYLDNDTYASGWTTNSENYDSYSIILNVHTGEYKKFIDNEMVSVVMDNSDEHYMVWSNNKSYLLSDKDLSVVDTGQYEIVGDTFSEQEVLGLISNSSKYIVAMKDLKYGLIDYDGNVIIEAMYEELFTIDDNLLYALKDGKYGIINSNNEVIIDFKYDTIVAIDNYYVVSLGNKLGVIDKEGKEVVPLDIDIFVESDDEYSISTSFFTYYSDGKVVVEYYDSNEESDYLIIDSDGKYEKQDSIITRYYNLSDTYYYVKEVDGVVNFYDQEDNLLGDIKCGGTYDFSFVDSENLSFICFSDDTEVKYFNVKDKKEVTEEDIDSRYIDFENVGELYVFNVDSNKIVVSFVNNGEMIFRLNKNDNIVYVCDNFYKVIHEDGTVDYYEVYLG